MNNLLSPKNILVTGGAGFIGSHIVDRLIALGNNVIIIDNFSTGKESNVNSSAKVYRLDTRDKEGLKSVFAEHKFDYVVHQAAKINLNVMTEDSTDDITGSVLGTLNILNCCVEFKIKKIIYASSVAVYGRPKKLPAAETDNLVPIYSYGIAKKCAEEYIKYFSDYYKLNYAILRYANVYGPRQTIHGEVGVIAIFCDRVIKGLPLIVYGDGTQTRDYIYVDDVADITLKILEMGDGEIFNVGCGRGITVNEVLKCFQEAAGIPLKIENKPLRVGEIGNFYSDTTKLVDCFKISPKISIKEGIQKTLSYYKNL